MDEMSAKKVLFWGLGAFALVFFGLSACAKGQRELKIPPGRVGIVAYGSLISQTSLEGSLGHTHEGPVYEVHLLGYERSWTCVRPWNAPAAAGTEGRKSGPYILRGEERVPVLGAAELDLQPKDKGRTNGLLYLIPEEDLQTLDKREWGYRRADVSGRIEEFRFGDGKVYVYEGLSRPAPGAPADGGTYVLIKEFFDLVTGACDKRGEAFRREFDKSTRPCPYPLVSYKDILREQPK